MRSTKLRSHQAARGGAANGRAISLLNAALVPNVHRILHRHRFIQTCSIAIRLQHVEAGM